MDNVHINQNRNFLSENYDMYGRQFVSGYAGKIKLDYSTRKFWEGWNKGLFFDLSVIDVINDKHTQYAKITDSSQTRNKP